MCSFCCLTESSESGCVWYARLVFTVIWEPLLSLSSTTLQTTDYHQPAHHWTDCTGLYTHCTLYCTQNNISQAAAEIALRIHRTSHWLCWSNIYQKYRVRVEVLIPPTPHPHSSLSDILSSVSTWEDRGEEGSSLLKQSTTLFYCESEWGEVVVSW